jgi:hypothetical protein
MESTQPFNRESNCEVVLERSRREVVPATLFLVLEAYLSLIRFDFYLARGNFEAIYSKVRNYEIGKQTDSPRSVETICSAVDMACIWYRKEVLCLQRSAVTACLLRKYGVSAHLVIGAQQMPFKAHAWVEVDGKVVNDKQYVPEMYGILTRC